MQRAELPDAHALWRAISPYRSNAALAALEVTRALPAADHLERFQRYLGGPAWLQAGRLGGRQRASRPAPRPDRGRRPPARR